MKWLLVPVVCVLMGICSAGQGEATDGKVPVQPGDASFVVVEKIPVADCRVVRGFLGTPVDGSVKSRDYRGRVREYPKTASDGVVYSFLDNDGVHVELADSNGVDLVVLRGGAHSRLHRGASYSGPEAGDEPLWTFPGGPEVQVVRFGERVRMRRASLFNTRDGEVADVGFYRVGRRDASGVEAAAAWRVGEEMSVPEPESQFAPESVRRALEERYPEGERRTLALVRDGKEGRPVAAFANRAVHFMTPAFEREDGLTGLALEMAVGDAGGPVGFTAAVQDPLDPRLDLAWVEFSVAQPGRVRVVLDVPDQVVLPGRRVWLTLRFDRDVKISGSDGGAPVIRLMTAEKETVLPEALAWRKFLMRTFFSLLSEPRPWGGYRDQSREEFYARNEYTAQCPELFMTIDLCYALAPSDDLVRQYREWVFLRNLETLSEVEPPSAPPEGVPEWAWYPRLAWLEVLRIADWWVQERLVSTGEFGGRVGDDSDFYQQFLDLPYFDRGGVAAKMMDSAARMAELADRENLRGGINIRATDALHAYEEGINHLALMARWFYGDPVYFERCMDSARNMEFLTVVTPDGRRHFPDFRRMGLEDIENPREPKVEGHASPLMWHTAFQVTDYNRNPNALRVLREWADTWLGYMKPGRWATSVDVATGEVVDFREDRPLYGGYSTQATTFTWLYGVTGDARYIEPFLHYYRQGEAPYPSNRFLGDVYTLGGLDGLDRRTLEQLAGENPALALYVAKDFGPLKEDAIGRERSRGAGISDLYDARRWPDMYTSSHQFTDRIFPSILGSGSVAHLGGYTRRNKFNPTLAVSWEGLGTDYGALVVENKRDRMKALVYSFADRPVQATMRVWMLDHGRYALSVGTDRDGDWEADRATRRETVELARADGVGLTVAPGQVTVIHLKQVERLDSIFERADLAIAAREVEVEGRTVRGTVHNIGSADVEEVVVAVLDAAGNAVASVSAGRLSAPLDLMPRRAGFEVSLPAEPGEGWRLTLDPDGRVPEIYEGNNTVYLDALPAVDYAQGWD